MMVNIETHIFFIHPQGPTLQRIPNAITGSFLIEHLRNIPPLSFQQHIITLEPQKCRICCNSVSLSKAYTSQYIYSQTRRSN